MTNDGWVALRRGLLKHILQGRLSSFDTGIYARMLLEADRKTGLWWGSAKKLLALGPSDSCLRRVQESLKHLEEIGFARRFRVPGKHGNYPVLINKFLCTDGSLKGMRLNAEKSNDWQHPVYELCTEEGTERGTERGTEAAPSEERQEKKKKKKTTAQALPSRNGFDLFWEEYPRKAAKPAARRAWGKIKPSEVQAVMVGLKRWKRSEQWTRDGVEFIPHPTTFLNQRRWEDMAQQSQRQEAGQGQEREMVKARIPA